MTRGELREFARARRHCRTCGRTVDLDLGREDWRGQCVDCEREGERRIPMPQDPVGDPLADMLGRL